MVYVTSDLHGYSLDKFREILEKVNFSADDFLYILGDVIDRGPDGVRILRWLLAQPNVQLILGNHEMMMLSCDFLFDEITDASIENLTGSKLISYSVWASNSAQPTLTALSATRNREIQYILDYLRDAPLYELITVNGRDFLLVHSGLGNFRENKKLSEYSEMELLWTRPTLADRYFENITTVFGHTPTVYFGDKYKGKAIATDTWIDIDVGAGLGLTPMLLRLDDMKEFYFE
jgi:serine/threonine protein phosphatase 1